MPGILFRVDAGRVWGVSMGHAMRSSILARKLASEHEITYLMKAYEDGLEYVRGQGFKVVTIPVDDDSDEIVIDACKTIKPEILVCDLINTPYITLFDYCRNENVRTAVFDTKGFLQGSPDVIVNAGISISKEDYPYQQDKTGLFLGTEYFMTARDVEKVPIRSEAQDVMITMGGSDPANLTAPALECIISNFEGLNVHVVLGPSFCGLSLIERIAAGRDNVFIHQAPDNFLELLAMMDIVVTAGGLTLYECAWLGRPSISIPSIEHEEYIAQGFSSKAGFMDLKRYQSGETEKSLVQSMHDLLQNKNKRCEMSLNGQTVVDGCGAERILKEVFGINNNIG